MPTQRTLLFLFFLAFSYFDILGAISVNYTSGKMPALINISSTINPSLLTVTSNPVKRVMTLDDLTPAAQGHHPSSAKSYGSKHGSYQKHYGKKSHGHGSHHHGNNGHHSHHGSDGYSHDDMSKHGKEHEDYSKGSRGKHWDKFGEKEKVIKDKGSGFIKAFTWDREEINRDKWADKGDEYNKHSKGSKGREYGKKRSQGKGHHDWGDAAAKGVWGASDYGHGLSGYATISGDNSLSWADLQGLHFYG